MRGGEEEITEEQRKRAEANRAAALAKRKAILSLTEQTIHQRNQHWGLFKCQKIPQVATAPVLTAKQNLLVEDPALAAQSNEKFRARLEICSPDSFSVTPVAVEGFVFPGEEVCFERLRDCLSNVIFSHFTQNTGGGKACVYKLYDYHSVLRALKSCKGIECEAIPWGTFNVVEKLSHSFISGKWVPCRPEHLPDEKVDDLIAELPKTLVNALLPFQLDGVRFGLRRGGWCLIADEMGLGKTLQAIALAGCFRKEGSILVVCPAILRYSWAEELERWFPSCLPSDIHLVFGHQDNPARLATRPKVVVISYTMLRRLRSSMLEQEWVTLIVDESHHLHCSKKSSEIDQLQVVLDVAIKVKHLILLSGTPSLSRPGLLGQTKYEFAKTYCSVKFNWGCQGKIYQDFSKGIRLEELNILLKQSVMIRRLKEHVLLQLPPKRRQIIKLVLKRSDINLAMETLGLENAESSADTNSENAQCNIPDKNEDTEMNKKLERKLSSLGIAKLPGFFEWLSIHPIMVERKGEEFTEESSGSHKMIIFAYHHKVLDGVQAFLCEKGVQFVRIDCTVAGHERQSAIHSFQSSKEVKIALIGIRAGSTGLNLTSADNVVFLEMPTSPADILQAEDRAHRHGQTRPVNVYIFCGKDTADESQWQKLNKSSLRVSSTMNGKRDALHEIEIEGISNFESTGNASSGSKQLKEFPNSCQDHPMHVPGVPCDDGLSEVNKSGDGENEHKTTLNDDGHAEKVEFRMKSSIQSSTLRFEVSKHTGRIHLYSCNPGTNSRPTPLFKNIRPEEIGCLAEEIEKPSNKSIEDILPHMESLIAFNNEWKNLRAIEKTKLVNKPLQLPLSCELFYLEEGVNHDKGGLLRGGSKKRKTALLEISHPLPSDATWKKVVLHSGHGCKDKDRLYTQGWSSMDEPLCKLCQSPCTGNNAKCPQFFEDLFCGLDCHEEYRLRTSNRFLRQGLFQIEHGVCSNCKLDCHQLVKHLRVLRLEKRHEYVKKRAPQIAKRNKLLDKLVNDPTEGNAWHADHIIPVFKGGGECKLENMRTLCVACHADVTSAQCSERRKARKRARKQLKETMDSLTDVKKSGECSNVLGICLEFQNIEDDDLLIEIPGSSYSGANIDKTKEQNQEQEPLAMSSVESMNRAGGGTSSGTQSEETFQDLENSCDPAESAHVDCNEVPKLIDQRGTKVHRKLSTFAYCL